MSKESNSLSAALGTVESRREAGRWAHKMQVEIGNALSEGRLSPEQAKAYRREIQEGMGQRTPGRRAKRPDTQNPFDA